MMKKAERTEKEKELDEIFALDDTSEEAISSSSEDEFNSEKDNMEDFDEDGNDVPHKKKEKETDAAENDKMNDIFDNLATNNTDED